jgi:hypothetical protein
MTIAEVALEYEIRRETAPTDYAGGMTEGDIESIREESAALREQVRKRRQAQDGNQTGHNPD